MARLLGDRWYRRAIDPPPIPPQPCKSPACSSSALGERRSPGHGRTARSDGLQTEKALHRPEVTVAVQQCVTALDTERADDKVDRLSDRNPAAARKTVIRRSLGSQFPHR